MGVLGWLVTIAAIAVIGIVLTWVLSERMGTGEDWGPGGGGIDGLDEVFAPTRKAAREEMELQHSMPAPAPIPGDPPGMRWELAPDGTPTAVVLGKPDGAPSERDGGTEHDGVPPARA